MSTPIEIGMICKRGGPSGHLSLRGEDDYGYCEGKAVAKVYLYVEDIPGLIPEYKGFQSSKEVADQISELVREHYDMIMDREQWDED